MLVKGKCLFIVCFTVCLILLILCFVPIMPQTRLLISNVDDISYYYEINSLGLLKITLIKGSASLDDDLTDPRIKKLKQKHMLLLGKKRYQVFDSIKATKKNGLEGVWYSVLGQGIKDTAAIIDGSKYWSIYYTQNESRNFGNDPQTVQDDLINLSNLLIQLAPN